MKEKQNNQNKSPSKIKNIWRRKFNTYNLTGDYGIGYTTKGEEFWFDLEDYDLIKDDYWFKQSHGYIASIYNGKQTYLHRLVTNCKEDEEVDHIYHNEYDNRKSNLRVTSHKNNLRNQVMNLNNTSGIVGVSFYKRQNKWRAYITYNTKQINLGYYFDIEDAKNARKEAEELYFGEFSYDNSMNKTILN